MTKEVFLRYFEETYRDDLDRYQGFRRYGGFRAMFEALLHKKTANFNIIETGTLRKAGEWQDGQSSLLFYDFITKFGGTLTSIDTDPMALAMCSHALTERVRPPKDGDLRLMHGNSLQILETLREPVDLVYLDSFDLDLGDPEPSMRHHLQELASLHGVIEKSPGLIVGIDDNKGDFGKGKYVAQWARETGKQFLYDGYQTVFKFP